MHDVLGQLMVAAGDEHLLAEQPVAAIRRWPRERAQVTQGRALTGLGEGHGAAEATGQHRREKARLQFG
ncbi:hypothetical protein D3C84_1228940 [compost metagenome]